MAITEITIQNFKGIGGKVTVPLRPLTLLFVANSAGKSTILQALLYFRELLEHGNADADRLANSGTAIDLGGFEKFVHRHDLDRIVQVGVTANVDDDGLPVYPIEESMEGGNRLALPLCGVHTVTITISIRWDAYLESPKVTSYAVQINGEYAGAFVHSRALNAPERLIRLADDHPIFTAIFPNLDEESLSPEMARRDARTGHLRWVAPLYVDTLARPATIPRARVAETGQKRFPIICSRFSGFEQRVGSCF